MTTGYKSFIDGVLTAANRITSSWLNPVSDLSYKQGGQAFITVSGTNTLVGIGTPIQTTLTKALFWFLPANTNTGPVTLSLDGLGAASILAMGEALVGGELLAGYPTAIYWDGTEFQLCGGPSTFAGSTKARAQVIKNRDVANVEDYPGATIDAMVATAIAQGALCLDVSPGTYQYTSPLYMVSPAGASFNLRGHGRGSIILQYVPAAYNILNFAIWAGDHTNNVATAYSCKFPQMSDFTLQVGQFASGGIRVREGYQAVVRNINIGPYAGQLVGSATHYFWGLMVESNINSTYADIDISVGNGHQDGTILTTALDIHQSRTLDPNGGNTGVSTCTTTTLNRVYCHLAADAITATGSIECTLDGCIQEACVRGLTQGPSFPLEIVNHYSEGINNPLNLAGSSVNNPSQVNIRGFFMNLANAGTGANDCAIKSNFGVLSARDLTIATIYAQRNFIQSTNPVRYAYDLVTKSAQLKPNGPVACMDGKVTTTLNSAIFQVEILNHGLTGTGQLIGLQGFTTPFNGLALNQPYYSVESVVDTDRLRLQSVLFPTVVATGSGDQAGSLSETWVYYPANCWATPEIQDAQCVTPLDCEVQSIDFTHTFGSSAGATALLYDGMDGYYLSDWTYIMDVQAFSSTATTGHAGNLIVDLPNGYEVGWTLVTLPTLFASVDATVTQYGTTLTGVGIKLPPGTVLRSSSTASAAALLIHRVRLARTGVLA